MKKLLIFSIVFILFLSFEAYSQIVVIANKDVSVSSINLDKLRNIYTLDSKELGGNQIKLFDYSSSIPTQSDMYSKIGKDASTLKKSWLKAKLTGSGNPPVTVGSEADMLQKVANNSGAIGYVDKSIVNDSVKILLEL